MKKYHFFTYLMALALTLSALALPTLALEPPAPQCAAAIVVDGDHGEVLFEKNGYQRMYPASITKIMTSLLVLEAIERGELSLDTPVTASPSAVAAITPDSSTQDIKAGEVLTVEHLLYCDLVASANEACNILAEKVGGSMEGFVELMNQRAAQLGMENTHFVNPHGLHSPDHYTTAWDIYLMAREAMNFETFRTIVATPYYQVPATNMSQARPLYNTNALISNWRINNYLYPQAIGIKTGSTQAAGQCLASAAVDNQGRTFYCVVLGAQNITDEAGNITRYSFLESRNLLEWAFSSFKRITLIDETAILREVPVGLSDTDYVLAQPVGSISRTMPTDYDPEQAELRIDLPDMIEAPVEKGQKLGLVTLVYEGEELGFLELVAANAVERSDVQYYIKTIQEVLGRWWVKLLVGLAVVLLLFLVFWLAILGPRRHRKYRATYRRGYSGNRRRRY